MDGALFSGSKREARLKHTTRGKEFFEIGQASCACFAKSRYNEKRARESRSSTSACAVGIADGMRSCVVAPTLRLKRRQAGLVGVDAGCEQQEAEDQPGEPDEREPAT